MPRPTGSYEKITEKSARKRAFTYGCGALTVARSIRLGELPSACGAMKSEAEQHAISARIAVSRASSTVAELGSHAFPLLVAMIVSVPISEKPGMNKERNTPMMRHPPKLRGGEQNSLSLATLSPPSGIEGSPSASRRGGVGVAMAISPIGRLPASRSVSTGTSAGGWGGCCGCGCGAGASANSPTPATGETLSSVHKRCSMPAS
mmetsp:Transcript_228/g.582  ORF Transcript_228/g.582 Transcript_228/m.582 type:complete len:205 (-) Transcript_228:899-1513(-)